MSDRRYIAEPQSPPKQRADEQAIDYSPLVHDQVATTTCYMCACRCGIKVHLQDGRIRYIEGNRDHPVNKGVLCAKGSAGIMTQYAPARLRKPLKRVGERGKGEFQEIEWDEALRIATEWLGKIRATDPRKLAFFTGRELHADLGVKRQLHKAEARKVDDAQHSARQIQTEHDAWTRTYRILRAVYDREWSRVHPTPSHPASSASLPASVLLLKRRWRPSLPPVW